ncbi:MAG: YkgJ family cysteine cluster protein [Candidatus Omnitrophota bacterium]
MTLDIKPFVPSDVCLSCGGCCRFCEQHTPWTPLFLFEEIRALLQKELLPCCLFSHAANKTGEAARIDLLPSGEGWICPCLDEKTSRCGIYEDRPLECRLYPFLLVSHEGRRVLAVDPHCPYIQERLEDKEFAAYLENLRQTLSSAAAKKVFKENGCLFQKYPQGYRILRDFPEF